MVYEFGFTTFKIFKVRPQWKTLVYKAIDHTTHPVMFTNFVVNGPKLPCWLVVWNHGFFYEFPYLGNNDPNWRTHIFQRGRYTTNQIECVSPVSRSLFLPPGGQTALHVRWEVSPWAFVSGIGYLEIPELAMEVSSWEIHLWIIMNRGFSSKPCLSEGT